MAAPRTLRPKGAPALKPRPKAGEGEAERLDEQQPKGGAAEAKAKQQRRTGDVDDDGSVDADHRKGGGVSYDGASAMQPQPVRPVDKVGQATPVLPHSPAALLHKMQSTTPKAPRNMVQDRANLDARFAVSDVVADVVAFTDELSQLVQKVEAGAYRNRNLQSALSKIELPREKDVADLFAPDANPSIVNDRDTLLDVMQRLADVAGDHILLPSWPARVAEVNALWQLADVALDGDAAAAKQWAQTLLDVAPKGPFADYAKAFLDDAPLVNSVSQVEALRASTSDVHQLCRGMQKLAEQVERQPMSDAEVEEALDALPDPSDHEVAALWSDDGDDLRQALHDGMRQLATSHPDVEIFDGQTLKEASLYADVIEAQYAFEHGTGQKAALMQAAQSFVDAFPHSERSPWLTSIVLDGT